MDFLDFKNIPLRLVTLLVTLLDLLEIKARQKGFSLFMCLGILVFWVVILLI